MAKTKKVKQPEVPAPTTYEGWLEVALESFERMNANDQVSEPNYLFRVGQEVQCGGRGICRVEGVMDGGKRIHISYQDVGESCGKPYDNGRKPAIYWWHNITPSELVEDTHFSRPRLRTQYMQSDLRGLIHRAYYRGLMTSPEYQRGYVWSLEDKQRLVRSMFDRADIGKFVFVSHPYPENRLEVVDGKQRLRAIMDFMENRFPYEGKTWYQLSWEDRHAFTDVRVQTCELDAQHVKRSDILWLFLQLNSGGVPQTEEHIAKARKLYEAVKAEEEASGV